MKKFLVKFYNKCIKLLTKEKLYLIQEILNKELRKLNRVIIL